MRLARSFSFASTFSLAAMLLPASSLVAQERAPAYAGETPLWITLATEDLALLRQTQDAAGWATWLDELESHDGVSLIPIQESQLLELSQIMHRRFRRCGGFLAFDQLSGALDHLYVKRAADPEAVFVTYTIDQPTEAAAVVNEAQPTQILDTITQLSSNTTRYYTSSGGVNAANQLKARWEGYAAGRSDVTVELYTHSGWAQPSVIATITGTTFPSEVIVVGGHLDSINGPTGTAPGADDDAAGVASLTEAFRAALAVDFYPQRTVKFMAYAAEEVGLRGSAEIAAAYRSAGINVIGVLQLDMTNFKGSTVDMAFLSDRTNVAQTNFVKSLVTTYLPTLTYTNTSCGYGCSDHAAWHAEGFAATMPSEAIVGQHNPNLHTTRDTLANSDPTAGHAVKFARLAAVYVVELAKGSLGAPVPLFADGFESGDLSAWSISSP